MFGLFRRPSKMTELRIGNRLKLSGGYDMDPKWLGGGTGYLGKVIAFIPGQDEQPAVVVRLEHPITVEGITGDIVVLELRFVGAAWKEIGTVHVELCDFVPAVATWKGRKQGKWIESHATYTVVKE